MGAEICCWQFNVHSTPLTDSSAIPAVDQQPHGEQYVLWCRIQVLESPALGKGKAEAIREGKAQPQALCANPASREW